MIDVTLYADPSCPHGHAAGPALTVLRWRYPQLRWSFSMARRADAPADRVAAARARAAAGERSGMPVDAVPRLRAASSGRSARAFVAARMVAPERAWAVLRALQLAWSASTALLDEDEAIAAALWSVDGLDVVDVLAAMDDADVARATATERRRPALVTPALVFSCGGRALVARGLQPVEAYEVLLANLVPLAPRAAPASVAEALAAFPHGLATAELAALLGVDRGSVRAQLVDLLALGAARRLVVGDDAVWRLCVSEAEAEPAAAWAVATA
jgi:hypothetical protein